MLRIANRLPPDCHWSPRGRGPESVPLQARSADAWSHPYSWSGPESVPLQARSADAWPHPYSWSKQPAAAPSARRPGRSGSISCHLEAPSQPPHSARANHDGGGKTAPGTPHWMVESPQRIVQIMCGVSVKLWVACFHRHIFVLACLWFLPIVLRRRDMSPGLPRDRRKY